MSEALDILRAATTADVICKSGITYTVQPPRIEDCIAYVGDVPLPVLEEIARREKAENPEDMPRPTLEEMGAMSKLDQAYVLLAVRAVNGKPVEGDELTAADIPAEDFDELKALAKRETPLPGKG